MKIAIFAENKEGQYSGGRYHSWMMAEALANAGHFVVYVTNKRPIFCDDFIEFPNHKNIHLWVSCDFWFNLPEGKFDLVFLVPSMNKNQSLFLKVIHFSEVRCAKLCLLNFETPNWYNLLSPVKIDYSFWNNWKLAAFYSSLILSSSKEGNKYAKEFYNCCSPKTRFEYCYPSINDIVADSIIGQTKEKRIIVLTRFENADHKGGNEISELYCEAMSEYTLVFIVGMGSIPPNVFEKLNNKAVKYNIKIEVKYKLSDYEKFREIKRSSLMLFPSYFEGFGYPPIETQYCNVPCIVFDLPVLRETSGDKLIYVEHGNWLKFKNRIEDTLRSDRNYDYLRDGIADVARFDNYTYRLDQIVKTVFKRPSAQNITPNYFLIANYIIKPFLWIIRRRTKELFISIMRLVYSMTFPFFIIFTIYFRRALLRAIRQLRKINKH